jgi:hypothetical protein
MFNHFLRETEDVSEAKKRATEAWETMPQEEKEKIKAKVKAKRHADRPPPPEETPAEKAE